MTTDPRRRDLHHTPRPRRRPRPTDTLRTTLTALTQLAQLLAQLLP